METKKTTTKKATKATAKATVATKAKAKRKKREPQGWYIDERGVRIPLSEFFKNDPPRTGPSRWDVMKKLYPDFGVGEIVDMRAVLK